ncbi:phosphatidate cytidylyltransferase [Candidatus Bathyarchaeota archaeon]|nr:phosphatidate cytidylyltransferase [Candidatus Bathyarchaeota archaeon]
MTALQVNLVVMAVCYLYIIVVILVASYLKRGILSPIASRKFLHSMIGNLPLIMPFFTQSIFPFLVAIPFIIITFLATPYSPTPWLSKKLSGLTDITGEGHHTGLVLYAISYTILAYLYGVKPYIVAAGIFPMAYGDSSAALLGMRYGHRRVGGKSLEGSSGMFIGSLISLLVGMRYFSSIYGFSISTQIIPIILVAIVTTVTEFLCPNGLDNIAVPILGATTFILAGGGA